jgi:acid phosphatase family membrane protein YuiD
MTPHMREFRDVLKCVVAHGADPIKSLCTLSVLLGRDLGTTYSLFWNSMSFLVILHSHTPSQRQHFGERARSSNRISGKILAQLQKDQPCSSRHL